MGAAGVDPAPIEIALGGVTLRACGEADARALTTVGARMICFDVAEAHRRALPINAARATRDQISRRADREPATEGRHDGDRNVRR
jgi:hypothetical protein